MDRMVDQLLATQQMQPVETTLIKTQMITQQTICYKMLLL